MSGLSAPTTNATETWSRIALRWLKVVVAVTAVVAALTLAAALFTGGLDAEWAGKWLMGAGFAVGVAGVLVHLQSLGFVAPYDYPHRPIEGTRAVPGRAEGYETVLLAAAVTALLLLAGFALGAGR